MWKSSNYPIFWPTLQHNPFARIASHSFLNPLQSVLSEKLCIDKSNVNSSSLFYSVYEQQLAALFTLFLESQIYFSGLGLSSKIQIHVSNCLSHFST